MPASCRSATFKSNLLAFISNRLLDVFVDRLGIARDGTGVASFLPLGIIKVWRCYTLAAAAFFALGNHALAVAFVLAQRA